MYIRPVRENRIETIISNNVISGSKIGISFKNRDEEAYEDIHVLNNLFIGDSLLLNGVYPDLQWQGLKYNAFFDYDALIDSLDNDLGYIGSIDNINLNGDSCDAGYNIYLEPHIVSLDSLDYHLYENSPLINAGNPDSAFFDLDGTINDIGLFGGPYGEEYEYPNSVGKSDVPAPEGFEMSALYPNPFNNTVTYEFNLPVNGDVVVKVYDVTGRLTYEHISQNIKAGRHRSFWHGTDSNGLKLSTGIYFIELTYSGAKLVRRGIMLK